MPVNTLLQMRRGTAATWTSTDPTLSAGEWGYETDTGRAKVGDGSTVWTSLKYTKLRYDDFITGSGVSITELTDGNSQVTGLSLSTDLAAGDNITLSESNGTITINGQAGITLSEGTGVHIVVDGADHEINVTYTNTEFLDAVDARVTAASISAEEVMDIVGTGVFGVSGVGINYKDTDNRLEFGLVNDSVTVGSTSIALGSSATTIAGLTSVTSTSFVGDLTGNADTATEATNVTASANNSTDETVYLTFVDGATGTQGIETDTGLTFNPSSDTLTVSTVAGDVTGNAGTADQVKTQQGSADANHYITFVDSDNGSATAETIYTDAGLYYNPSSNNLNVANNLVVGGNLTINGTTTTVNSTVVTIEDPVFVIGSGSPSADDNKDRGIAFNYYDGAAKIGFFGYDDNTGKFTFFTDATNTNEVFSGTKGELDASVDWDNLLNIDINDDDINASANINVSKLSASGLTIGDSTYNLGDSTTALSGMTSFAGTNAGSPVYLWYAVVDGGSP
jgi:hypothetical protein